MDKKATEFNFKQSSFSLIAAAMHKDGCSGDVGRL